MAMKTAKKARLTKRAEETTGNQSPCSEKKVLDYDPVIFVKCHARNNNPNDTTTQVWRAAFEPDVEFPGKTTNTVATCGGSIVCFLNATTGIVEKRYNHCNVVEDFYALAWAAFPIAPSGPKITLLATGGFGRNICLIHPMQLLCYTTFRAHTKAVNCLTFHSSHPTWLFSGSEDGKIHLWDINIPATPDALTQWYRKLLTLDCSYEVLQLALVETAGLLLTACNGGLLGWNVRDTPDNTQSNAVATIKYSSIPDIVFKLPDVQNQGKKRGQKLVDGLVTLTDDCIATKCSRTGQILLWSLSDSLKNAGQTSQKKHAVPISAICTLQWSSTSVDYLYLASFEGSGLVVCGDDLGKLWLYDVKTVCRRADEKPDGHKLLPSVIIPWPILQPDPEDGFKLEKEDQRVFINSCAISWNTQHLVACTNNGLVCLWKKCSD